MANKLGIFLAGGLIGAAAVYFTSPRSGFENRNLAKSAVNAVFDCKCEGDNCTCDTFQAAAKNVAQQAQDLAETVAEKGQEFYVTAVSKVTEFTSGSRAEEAANDELRAKIEAARQRIASQVIKNAEESQQLTEQIEVPASAQPAQ